MCYRPDTAVQYLRRRAPVGTPRLSAWKDPDPKRQDSGSRHTRAYVAQAVEARNFKLTHYRVLEFGDLAARDIREIAFFDTSPSRDDRSFQGAWSVYPYLPSGTLILSDIGNGLFVLSLDAAD